MKAMVIFVLFSGANLFAVALAAGATETGAAGVPGRPVETACLETERDETVATVEDGVTDVPIRMFGTFIIVDVAVNGGEPRPFVLDTGASGSLVDTSAAPGIDPAALPPVTVVGVGGEQTFAAAKLDDLAVGGAHVKNVPVALGDLGGLGGAMGMELGGILGYDFLRHFVLTLDYDAGRIKFYDRGAFQDPAGVEFLPAEFDSGHPFVEMGLDSYRGKFVIDLGNASGIILNGDFVAREKLLDKAGARLPAMLRGAGGAKSTEAYVVRMGGAYLGSFEILKPVVVLPVSGEAPLTCAKDTIGNLGYGVMSRFTVYFDYPGGRVGLVPGKRFDAPFDYNRAGVVLRPGGDHYVVEKVMAGCPAAALVAPGDKVVAINGKAAAEVPPPAWAAIWSQPAGTKVTFTLARANGGTENVSFELADLL